MKIIVAGASQDGQGTPLQLQQAQSEYRDGYAFSYSLGNLSAEPAPAQEQRGYVTGNMSSPSP